VPNRENPFNPRNPRSRQLLSGYSAVKASKEHVPSVAFTVEVAVASIIVLRIDVPMIYL